jgi:uncharacterized repeat protein (TIGR02543 family)
MFSKKITRFGLAIIVSVTMVFSCSLSVFATDTSSRDGLSSISEDSLIASLTTEPEPNAEFDGYIVNLKDSKAAKKKIDLNAAKKVSEEIIDGQYILVNNPEDVFEFADLSVVEAIEPNYIIRAIGYPSDANDPYYSSGQWDLPLIHVPALWTADLIGDGVIVAILDTGINKYHEDFVGTSIPWGRNYSDSYSDPTNYIDDNGHGSFVAGLIAAQTNNGIGIAGITDEIDLEILKVLDGNGEGSTIDFVAALSDIYNEDNDLVMPDVINMSLGWSGTYNSSVDEKIQNLINEGVIIVAAAGNNGTLNSETTQSQLNQISYPAAFDGVIGVGATDSNDAIANYSTKNSTVDVSAPGSDMVSLWCGAENTYKAGDGTSFASPVVAAIAAAVKYYADENDTTVDSAKFLSLLAATSLDLGVAGKDTSFGFGRVQCDAIVATLDNDWEPISLTASFNGNGGNISFLSVDKYFGNAIGTLPTASRSGYTFAGWYTAASGGSQISSITPLMANTTYYAHWTGWTNYPGQGWKYQISSSDAKGWQYISGKWYYLNVSTGIMASGWQYISGKWYYLGSADSGVMQTGWQYISGKWYYLGSASSGAMTSGWQYISGKWYYLGSANSGVMVTGKVKIGGKTYRFNSSGVWIK